MSEKESHEKGDQNACPGHNAPNISINIAAIGSQPHQSEPAEPKQANKAEPRPKHDRLDWANFFVLLLTFFAAVSAAVAGGLLAIYTHQTLDDTRKQFAETNRANITVRDVKITPITQNGKMTFFLGTVWENNGNSPPLYGSFVTNWIMPVGEMPSGFSRCNFQNEGESTFPIGAHSTGLMQNAQIPSHFISDFAKGTYKHFYIWGRFDYRDGVTDHPHSTRYCWEVRGIDDFQDNPGDDLKFVHQQCTEGNCVDQECEKEDTANYTIPKTPGGCSMAIVPNPSSITH